MISLFHLLCIMIICTEQNPGPNIITSYLTYCLSDFFLIATFHMALKPLAYTKGVYFSDRKSGDVSCSTCLTAPVLKSEIQIQCKRGY